MKRKSEVDKPPRHYKLEEPLALYAPWVQLVEHVTISSGTKLNCRRQPRRGEYQDDTNT